MALESIGLSIGLTGSPREYPQLYKYNQQLEAAKRKAKDDKIDEIVNNVAVKAGDKLHKLEVEPMRLRVGKFIDEANKYKQVDDMQGFMRAVSDFQADVNYAQERSKNFNELEKNYREAASGNKYVFKNQKDAVLLMKDAASTADYIDALNKNGIQKNSFFDYGNDGTVYFSTVDRYDTDKAVRDLIDKNKIVLAKKEYTDPTTKAKAMEFVKGIPLDEDEAKYLNQLATKEGRPVGGVLTANKIASTLLSNPGFAAQYIDEYDLQGLSLDDVEKHFYETKVLPNVKREEGAKYLYQKPSTTVIVNNEKQESFDFSGGPRQGLYFGSSTAKIPVDSPYSVPLAIGDLSFRITPGKQWISKADGAPLPSSSSTAKIETNYINVLPYILVDGVKVVTTAEASKKANNGKVQYAPFVEGKVGYLTQAGVFELTNKDYYTEFDASIIPNFRNQIKNDNARIRFVKQINQMRQAVSEANRTGTTTSFEKLSIQ